MSVTLIPVAKYRYILKIAVMTESLHARHGKDEANGTTLSAVKEKNSDNLLLHNPCTPDLTLSP